MGPTSFYVVRISRRALLIGVLTFIVISALIVYGARQRQRDVPTVSRLAIVLDEPAPEFTLLDTFGNEYSLQTFQDKGLVLVFWTTWCPNCATTLQMIEQVHGQLDPKGDIALVGVNMMEDAATVGRFTTEHGLRFLVLMDTDASASNTYAIRIVPSVIIIDEYGLVRERMLGRIERDTFTARLQSIVPAEPEQSGRPRDMP